jgi:hypothetical protein
MVKSVKISKHKSCIKFIYLNDFQYIPGHFFGIERGPYLFPMFSFRKHRSMHVCNHVTKVTKTSPWQFNKMVKLFEEEIHIMQLFYANQSIRNVRDISNATHDRPIPSIGTIFNIISKSLVFGIVGCIATHNALICVS